MNIATRQDLPWYGRNLYREIAGYRCKGLLPMSPEPQQVWENDFSCDMGSELPWHPISFRSPTPQIMHGPATSYWHHLALHRLFEGRWWRRRGQEHCDLKKVRPMHSPKYDEKQTNMLRWQIGNPRIWFSAFPVQSSISNKELSNDRGIGNLWLCAQATRLLRISKSWPIGCNCPACVLRVSLGEESVKSINRI